MIIVALQGGLGNQMFQYACARQLAIQKGVELKIDLTFYLRQNAEKATKREFELGVFKFDNFFASPGDLELFFPAKTSNKFSKLYDRLRYKIRDCVVFKEKSMLYDIELGKINSKDIFLNGYWQCEKYFLEISDTIRNDFTFRKNADNRNIELIKTITQCNSVSIHIRRGDYVNNPVHGTFSMTYYKQAIEYIRERVTDPVFYFFSDEPEWVMNNFNGDVNCVYVLHNGDKHSSEDLRLMQHCRHNIIANSSFSWWGAWLNENPDKIVIAPQEWFKDPVQNLKTSDLVPGSWIRI